MSEGEASTVPTQRRSGPKALSGPAVLRALAAAFAHLQDFNRFVSGLQAALNQTEWFGRVTLELEDRPGSGEAQFAIGEMTLPVQGTTGSHGVLRAAGHGVPRFFGSEDLHLLASLADFLAVVLDRAREWREAARQRQFLGFLLNQAPVGILAFDERHHVTAGNDLARRWLGGGGDLWGALQTALPDDLRLEASAARSCFHLRVDGRLIFGELRTTPGTADAAGVCVVVMTDLTPEQARLLDALRRETYRCQWRRLRLGFALLESPRIAGGLLQQQAELRAGLPASVTAGPYDANRLGLVFPECGRNTVVAQLRRLKPLLADAPVRAGVAELGRDGAEPEALLQAALAGLRPFGEAVRPALLLHDDNPAVNDALAYMLGGDFELVKSTSLERTRELLRTRNFDALITEVELRDASGLELARLAEELQPGIRPFFTTISELPAAAAKAPDLADAVVFQKPFNARALAQTVREKLGM
jgi:CheY-like chemotaxis protein/PAS domain-containing protein